MKGYLVDIPPHVYQHVPERFHDVLHGLAQPWTVDEVADYAHYAPTYVKNYLCESVRDSLHIKQHGNSGAWRVALTRLYYGIDRCWCQS